MNKSIIRFILCKVLQFEGIFLILPFIVSLFYGEKEGLAYLSVGALSLLIGTIGSVFKPKSKVFYAREGYVVVSLAWILLSVVGAFPFFITGEIPSYIDAFFETASGFSTTGASILTDVETLSYTSMFFRCFTNWIGGMGVLVFIMAVIPLSGSANMHLMRAESPGADVEKLVPKVKNTATILYGMYIVLTVVLFAAYLIAGVGVYDSFILSFATMGTGGFSRLNDSIAGYSVSVRIITAIFMLLGGINFNAYFLFLSRRIKDFFRIEEIRYYFYMIIVSTAVITFQIRNIYPTFKECLSKSLLQVISVVTTTGYTAADFDTWPMLSKTIIMILMVVGGCAGAAAGGIKVSRVIILSRTLNRELSHLTHPRSIRKVKLDSKSVGEDTIKNVSSFIFAYLLLVIVSTLLISINGFDFTTTFTSVITSVGNVGPGLSMVGPMGNFAELSAFSKLVLSFDMLAGRLEIFPMLVLFYPGAWKRS